MSVDAEESRSSSSVVDSSKSERLYGASFVVKNDNNCEGGFSFVDSIASWPIEFGGFLSC